VRRYRCATTGADYDVPESWAWWLCVCGETIRRDALMHSRHVVDVTTSDVLRDDAGYGDRIAAKPEGRETTPRPASHDRELKTG
jgi:hypothetical protein